MKRNKENKYRLMAKDKNIRILIVFLILSFMIIPIKGIQTGLDLQGGALIQIKTERPLTQAEMSEVINTMEVRINNMFHVRDVKIRPWGNDLILVEIAGVDATQAMEIIGNPGRLEVYVGNISAFTGDELVRVDVFGKNPSSNLYTVPFTISDTAATSFRLAAVGSNFDSVSMFMDRGTAIVITTNPTLDTFVNKGSAGGILVNAFTPETGLSRDYTYTEALNRNIIQSVPDLDDPISAKIKSETGVDTSTETIMFNDQEMGKYIHIRRTKDELGEEAIAEILEIIKDHGISEDSVEVYHSNMVNNAPLAESLIASLSAGQDIKSLLLDTGLGDQAREDARRVEIILRSGALPIRVSIAGSYEVPATLGERFANNAIISGALVLLGVSLVVFLRYRKQELVLPVLITGLSEVVLILGASSLIEHNIDLPSIAGIIAAIGTGFDNQIVILDEVLMEEDRSIMRRMKDAFFIVIGSWLTIMAAMVPLFLIGMAQLKGFAIVTIIGATSGVFITRPAYARLLHYNLKYK